MYITWLWSCTVRCHPMCECCVAVWWWRRQVGSSDSVVTLQHIALVPACWTLSVLIYGTLACKELRSCNVSSCILHPMVLWAFTKCQVLVRAKGRVCSKHDQLTVAKRKCFWLAIHYRTSGQLCVSIFSGFTIKKCCSHVMTFFSVTLN